MRLKTQAEIEKLSKTSWDNWKSEDDFEHDGYYYRDGYSKGYSQAQSDLVEQASEGFEDAHTLQQEKIEKLEKDISLKHTWVKHHQKTVEIQLEKVAGLNNQIDSLKSDLEWCFSKFRQMLPRMSESYGVGVEEGIREIRQRHHLDKRERG